MQNPLTFDSHNWLGYVLAVAIGILTGKGPDWYSAWQNRKKARAEIDLSDAQKRKTLAEARKIDIDNLDALMERLEEAAMKSAVARDELEKAKAVEIRLKQLIAHIRLKQYMDESELKRFLGE